MLREEAGAKATTAAPRVRTPLPTGCAAAQGDGHHTLHQKSGEVLAADTQKVPMTHIGTLLSGIPIVSREKFP